MELFNAALLVIIGAVAAPAIGRLTLSSENGIGRPPIEGRMNFVVDDQHGARLRRQGDRFRFRLVIAFRGGDESARARDRENAVGLHEEISLAVLQIDRVLFDAIGDVEADWRKIAVIHAPIHGKDEATSFLMQVLLKIIEAVEWGSMRVCAKQLQFRLSQVDFANRE